MRTGTTINTIRARPYTTVRVHIDCSYCCTAVLGIKKKAGNMPGSDSFRGDQLHLEDRPY